MRLIRSEVDKRAEFKLDKSITIGNSIGYIKFGEHNDYPNIIESLILGSPTAKACANILTKFLVGEGFVEQGLNSIPVSKTITGKPITLLDMLRSACYSAAFNNGFYIQVAPDLNGTIRDSKFLPFKNCRFSKPDDTGFIPYIAFYDNWVKTEKKFNKEDVKDYYTFNLNPDVLAKQANKDGKHKGQVYHCFIDTNYIYPLSPFDSAYLDMDTEQEIGKHKNNEIRNGLTDKTIFYTPAFNNTEEGEKFDKELKKFMGSRADKVMTIEAEFDEKGELKNGAALKSDKLASNVNDKLYESWEKTLVNNIRKAAMGMPTILIDADENKMGTTSGEAIIQATNIYNAITKDIRESISQAFKDIYLNFANDTLKNNQNWKIKELSFNGNTPIIPATARN